MIMPQISLWHNLNAYVAGPRVWKKPEMCRNGDDFHSRYMLKVWFEHALLYVQH